MAEQQQGFTPHSEDEIEQIFGANKFTVCVFCGASRVGEHYMEGARKIGRFLGRAGRRFIYGSGMRGMMGAAATEAFKSGAEVVGIIPSSWVSQSDSDQCDEISQTIHSRDIQHRKTEMIARSDAFVVLPGGIGTDDERTEAAAFNQTLRFERLVDKTKPVILLNTNGFYDHLLAHYAHACREGFIWEGDLAPFFVCDTPEEVAELIDIYERSGKSLDAIKDRPQCFLKTYKKNGVNFKPTPL